MIISNVTLTDFRNEFTAYNRAEQFSYEGLDALYELLEDCSQDMPIELDVIALCCDFTEYSDLAEALGNYDRMTSLEDLHDNTLVLELDNGGLILQNF